jgi:hypothetical protein
MGPSGARRVVRVGPARSGLGAYVAVQMPFILHRCHRMRGGASSYRGARTSVKWEGLQSFSAFIALASYFGVNSKNALADKQPVRFILKYVALMCLVLTFWSAVAFAAHHHSNRSESAKCTVCGAAQSMAPKATANLPKATFTPISTFRADPASAKERVVAFALSIRPPPAIQLFRRSICRF